MAEVGIEAYEQPSLIRLLSTIQLNTHDGEGMTPNPHASFCRLPTPDVFSNKRDDDGSEMHEAELLVQLPWIWECVLYQLPESRLYDGTPTSGRKFEEATGLSPLRFAQAWCEADGSIWRYFHPRSGPAGGKAVAEAMCEYWAVKVNHWRAKIDSVVKTNVINKMGGEVDFKRMSKMLEEGNALSEVMSFGGKRQTVMGMLRHLTITANPDCEAHPMRPLCTCPVALAMPIKYEMNLKVNFTHAWTAALLANDDAFLFNGNIQTSTLFKVRVGQTPAAFADTAITNTQNIPVWQVTDRPALVEAMLAFWAEKAAGWHASCRTKREVRTKRHEHMPETNKLAVFDIKTGFSRPMDPHEDLSSKDDTLCRYIKTSVGAGAGHQHTLVVYAGWSEATGLYYDVLRIEPCHETCGFSPGAQMDMHGLAAAFVLEDEANAKVIRADW
ncbi:hypothetical protein LTR85_008324 [Meristemomyces frigidus]|nr:hypothetical protein LTR85_008324 [Meristemomyces frigidus]